MGRDAPTALAERHGHRSVRDWQLHEAKAPGLRGAMVVCSSEGVGHADAQRLREVARVVRIVRIVRVARVKRSDTCQPIRFGAIGDNAALPSTPKPLFPDP